MRKIYIFCCCCLFGLAAVAQATDLSDETLSIIRSASSSLSLESGATSSGIKYAATYFISGEDAISYGLKSIKFSCPEGEKLHNGKCEKVCNESNFPFAKEPDNRGCVISKCESVLGNRYACNECKEGYESNAITGLCDAVDVSGYPVNKRDVNPNAGTTECIKSGEETMCRYVNCNTDNGWILEHGQCLPVKCNERLEKMPANCKDLRACISAGKTYYACKDAETSANDETGAATNDGTDATTNDGVLDASASDVKEGGETETSNVGDENAATSNAQTQGTDSTSSPSEETQQPSEATQPKAPLVKVSCKLGDIYYSDNTCSAEREEGKTPIGIVFNERDGLVVELGTSEGSWGPYTNEYIEGVGIKLTTADFNDTSMYTCPIQNFKGVTLKCDAIYKRILEDRNGHLYTRNTVAHGLSTKAEYPATMLCYNKTLDNQGWYLPSYSETGEWVHDNYDIINNASEKAGGDRFKYETSEKYDGTYMNSSPRVSDTPYGKSVYINTISPRRPTNALRSENLWSRTVATFGYMTEGYVRCVFSYKDHNCRADGFDGYDIAQKKCVTCTGKDTFNISAGQCMDCTGYNLNSCPEGVLCDQCKTTNSIKYKSVNCLTGYHLKGDTCEEDCLLDEYELDACPSGGECESKTCNNVTKYKLTDCRGGLWNYYGERCCTPFSEHPEKKPTCDRHEKDYVSTAVDDCGNEYYYCEGYLPYEAGTINESRCVHTPDGYYVETKVGRSWHYDLGTAYSTLEECDAAKPELGTVITDYHYYQYNDDVGYYYNSADLEHSSVFGTSIYGR